jgi:AcrR family transcriptional regulator
MLGTHGPGRYDRSLTSEQRISARTERLLDAATEVFAQRGYAGTRVEDVVAAAGISRRTLYMHVTSLDDLLTKIYERAVRASFMTVLQGLTTVDDPIARIHAGIAMFYALMADNSSAAYVVFEVYRHAGRAQAAQHELSTSRWSNVIRDFLTAAFAAGRVARAPDAATVFALTKGVEAVAVQAIQRGEAHTLRALAPQMSALLVAACGGERFAS